MPQRRAALALVLAVVAGLAASALAHRSISRFSSDSFQYLRLGDALAHGRGFDSGGSQHPDLSRAPLLPLLIAGATWLAGDPVRAGLAVVALCGAALAIPLFFLCRDLFGPRAGYAALPLAAVSCLVGTSDRVLPTPVHLLAAAAAAALLVRAIRRRDALSWTLAGAAAGLVALARPEGLPFLAFPAGWALLGPDPRVDPRSPRPEDLTPVIRSGKLRFGPALAPIDRVRRTGWLLLGAAVVVAPYLGWAASRLGRATLVPGAEYLRDLRYVADRDGLRHVPGPWVPWEERALFLLSADRRERVLDVYFRTRRLLPAAPTQIAPEGATAEPGTRAPVADLMDRRTFIARENLRQLPRHLARAHLLPPVPLLLGLAGVAAWLPRRRGWAGLGFAAALGATGLLPLFSHVEGRFLYLPFLAGAVVAAAGWGEVDRAAASLPGRGGAIARLALHGALAFGVAASGLAHRVDEPNDADLERAQRTLARRAGGEILGDAVLAVRPHFPFWAGRRYAPLPVGPPDDVLAYARLHGIRAMTLQVPYDLKRRPHLTGVAGPSPPAGFVRVDTQPIEGAGALLLFRLDP